MRLLFYIIEILFNDQTTIRTLTEIKGFMMLDDDENILFLSTINNKKYLVILNVWRNIHQSSMILHQKSLEFNNKYIS
jgi:hypothetical protein